MPLEKRLVKVIEKKNLGGEYWLLVLESEKVFEFQAGQYVSLKVSEEGVRRSYSIASRPGLKTIDLLVDVAPMGIGSKFVLNAKVGDEVEILVPMGVFFVKPTNFKKLLIATGSGITPMKAMAEELVLNEKTAIETKMIWGMRYNKGLFWLEEFKNLKECCAAFDYEVVISKSDEDWQGKKGHVSDVIEEWVNNGMKLAEYEVYICGNAKMIAEMAALLFGKGMPKEQINFEKFY